MNLGPGRISIWILLLAVNAAAWLVFVRRADTPRPSPTPAAPGPKHSGATNLNPASPAAVVIRTNRFQWAQLESEDYRTYIERLRSIGCPEQTIRDIVIADVENLMAPRVTELEGPREPLKYWKATPKKPVLASLETLHRKQDVEFEQRDIVRDLLGVDLAEERAKAKGERDFFGERLEFLPAEKRTRVRTVLERAQRDEVHLREQSWQLHDELTPEELRQLSEIEARQEREISALLSPPERKQFDLWFSPSAHRVREALSGLDYSEQDFLAVYDLQREFDQAWDKVDPASLPPARRQEHETARAQFDHEVRQRLGEDRYEWFQFAREPDYAQLQDTLQQFDLAPETVGTIYDYKNALTSERQRVRSNPELPAAEQQQVLQSLSEETARAVHDSLGAKAYQYYLRAGAGRWIWE